MLPPKIENQNIRTEFKAPSTQTISSAKESIDFTKIEAGRENPKSKASGLIRRSMSCASFFSEELSSPRFSTQIAAEPTFRLLRTVKVTAQQEMQKLTNTAPGKNILSTASTAVFLKGPRFSTISSVQTPTKTKEKWGGKPNLLFSPSKQATLDRTGTTLVLNWPASLHTCRTGDLIDKYASESTSITESLNDRFIKFGAQLHDDWETDAVRNGQNQGMFGKYTELALHKALQGKVLFQKGYELIESLQNAIPQQGALLRKNLVKNLKKNAPKHIQDSIFKSHKKYVQFLESTGKKSKAPNTIKALNFYKDYIQKNPDSTLNYFEALRDDLFINMRQELFEHYKIYSHQGLRHNEFVGRLFPWEIKGVEIGHIQNLENISETTQKIALSRKFTKDIYAERMILLDQFEKQGLDHPVIKEFLDAKDSILLESNQAELSNDEKNIIYEKIKNEMSLNISSYCYQNGHLQYLDLPDDLTTSSNQKHRDTFTRKAFISTSNQLRSLFNSRPDIAKNINRKLPLISYSVKENKILDSLELKMIAHKAVRIFLKSIDHFSLCTNKEDSGVMMITLLKNQPENRSISDKNLVEKYLDTFSIDTCMSILSSIHSKDFQSKSKYENTKTTISTKNLTHALSLTDYSTSSLYRYADQHRLLDEHRPLLSFREHAFKLKFNQMEDASQKNLIKAWNQRLNSKSPFKNLIATFIKKALTEYGIDLNKFLSTHSISEVWDELKIIEDEIFGLNHNNELSRELFYTLGGDWSSSLEIRDEQASFRNEFPESEWLINPFGKQYRQHKTGKGSLVPIGPSEQSIQLAEAEITRGRNPFNNLEDLHHILSRIKDPIDRFGLHAIFMNADTCASVSGTTLRMLNFWDEILTRLNEKDRKQAPTLHQIESLCKAYMAEGKGHHSLFEIEAATNSRLAVTDPPA